MNSRRRGFILIIVIGVLGTLGFVAINLHHKSSLATKLGAQDILQAKVHLLARSGIELGTTHLNDHIQNGNLLEDANANLQFKLMVGLSTNATDSTNVLVNDTSGQINVNDGISAGRLELGPLYNPRSLDPWEGNDPVEDKSAWINLRIRRLLNAYGEAHTFVATLGWPTWHSSMAPDPNYGVTYDFVSLNDSYRDERGVSFPKHDGLGDLILSNRPDNGFINLNELKNMINSWGTQHLAPRNATYLSEKTFFDLVKNDLTIVSFEDNNFYRINREFGPVFNNSFWVQTAVMNSMESNPPDISTASLWQQHPVNLINLNSASPFVKAAIFFAPANVTYTCEGSLIDMFRFGGSKRFVDPTPTLGVSGPCFKDMEQMLENGVINELEDGTSSAISGNHFMSLRDGLCLAQAIEMAVTIDAFHPIFGNMAINHPDSFTSFASLLNQVTSDMINPFERARLSETNSFPIKRPFNTTQEFTKSYVERALPYILSPLRRIPSWLGAPVSLMSPCTTPSVPKANFSNFLGTLRPRRSIEDFSFRSQFPKICFFPNGVYRILSSAALTDGGQGNFKSTQSITVKMFETTFLRSQNDLAAIHDDSLSDHDIVIGPELRNPAQPSLEVARHPVIGFVGLRDRIETPIGQRPISAYLSFDDINTSGGLNSYAHQGSSPATTLIHRMDASSDNWVTSNTTVSIGTVEIWPLNYETWPLVSPNLTKNFDPSFLGLLRGSPETGKTWKVPGPALDYLNTVFAGIITALGQGPTPINATAMESFLSNWWNVFNFGSGIPFQAGQSMDWYAWNFRHVGFGANWDLWAPNYNNGDPFPPTTFNIDHTPLQSSLLEDQQASFFGTQGPESDLHPFGGLFLSSMNHGLRAPNRFSDSLYFRPYQTLYDMYSGLPGKKTGAVFNKGLISLWYRVPSSVANKSSTRILFHINLWEKVELGDTVPPASTTIVERPVFFTCFTSGFDNGLDMVWIVCRHGRVPNWGPSAPNKVIPPWSDDIPLEQVDYPNIYDTTMNYEFLGFPRDLPLVSETDTVKIQTRFQDLEAKPSSYVATIIYTSPLTPGSWHRIIAGWDLSRYYQNPFRTTAWVWDPTTPKTNTIFNCEPLPSYSNQMMMSFGEMAGYFMASDTKHSSLSTLTQKEFYPMFRLDSCIDNVDIRLGDEDGSWFGMTSSPPPDNPDYLSLITTAIEADPQYQSRRYDVRPTGHPLGSREPQWVADLHKSGNPNLVPGVKIIHLGTRIFDVPLSYENDSGQHTSPRIDLNLESPVGTIISPDRGESPSNVPCVINRLNGFWGFSSKASKRYSGFRTDNSTRITLTYRALTVENTAIDGVLSNIPYIKEVSCRFLPVGGPRILSWSDGN